MDIAKSPLELTIEKNRKNLIVDMKVLSAAGYICYIVQDSDYGYIITPSDCILDVYQAPYNFGWMISNGSGNPELLDAVAVVTIDVVKQMERANLGYAYRSGATLYTSSSQWPKKYWQKDKLQLVTQEGIVEKEVV